MSQATSFEAYLISKRIDSAAFKLAEPELWMSWKSDFDQSHPNSFTVQRLNLINPVRRKYLLQVSPVDEGEVPPVSETISPPVAKPGKPVMKPRPKIN